VYAVYNENNTMSACVLGQVDVEGQVAGTLDAVRMLEHLRCEKPHPRAVPDKVAWMPADSEWQKSHNEL
jgi:hypothetical protein